MIHYAFGYSACVLVIFRVVWGFIGTRYARFTQFVKGPAEMWKYARALLGSHQDANPGHNPVGGIVMVGLMLLILFIGLTGYLSVKEFFGDLMSEVHEAISSLALAVVAIHVAAAIMMSFLQKENLVKAMVDGKKQGPPDQGIRYPQYVVGVLLIVASGCIFYLVISSSLPALTQ